jgi:hypothetical protein
MRAALRAMLLANVVMEAEIERLTAAVSVGFTRGKRSPSRQASETLDGWREPLGSADDLEVLQGSPDLPLNIPSDRERQEGREHVRAYHPGVRTTPVRNRRGAQCR